MWEEWGALRKIYQINFLKTSSKIQRSIFHPRKWHITTRERSQKVVIKGIIWETNRMGLKVGMGDIGETEGQAQVRKEKDGSQS